MNINHLLGTLTLLLAPILSSAQISKDGVISIIPGESFYIQFEVAEGKFKNPVIVDKMTKGNACVFIQCALNYSDDKVVPKNPHTLLTFMMKEQPNTTVLFIQKNVKGKVQYSCKVLPRGKKEYQPRRNLPLEMELPILQLYSEKISSIQLSKFKISSSEE